MAATADIVDFAQLKLGFIGCGKMAQAIVKGVIKAGFTKPDDITGSAIQETTIDTLKGLGIHTTRDNRQVARDSDVVVLAVKPHLIPTIISEICQDLRQDALVISVAAGVTLATLQEGLPEGTPVVRVMPNLPASIGWGSSAICLGTHALPRHSTVVCELFKTCGAVNVIAESHIDIVTALSTPMVGCVTIEALADGAVKMGLPRQLAIELAARALMGAAQLVTQTGQHPAAIKDAVCSPGGTTITALHRLEAGGYRAAAMDAIEAATSRARELGARK